ncbi:hypothetical protein YPPY66_2078, partial [Yersinia pestis PY-66]
MSLNNFIISVHKDPL